MTSILKVNTLQDSTGNTALTIANDGTTLPAKVPHWKLTPTATANHTTSTWSQVGLGTSIYDSHSLKSGNNVVITAATAGLYHLTAHIRLNNKAAGRLLVGVYIGGSGGTLIGQTETVGNYSNLTGKYQCAECNILYRLSTSDSLGMFVFHEYGSDAEVSGGGHESWFMGYRISV